MGTSRIKKSPVGFGKRKCGGTVAERKKARRLMVRKMAAELKAAGKHIDLQAINQKVVEIYKRKRQGRRPKGR